MAWVSLATSALASSKVTTAWRLLELAAKPWITGFTTNPTLMRKAGLTDYPGFARDWGVAASVVLIFGLSGWLYVQFKRRDWL